MGNEKRLAFKKTDYEYRDLGELPIPLDKNIGLFTSPFVQMVGGKDDNDAVMPFKVDSTGRLDVIGVCPTHQPQAIITQANPTSGTKYTVLDTTEYIRIISAYASPTWTVQPTPLEMWITIDGVTERFFKANPASGGTFCPELFPGGTPHALVGSSTNSQRRSFLLEGREVKVEVEITGGTVSSLDSNIQWAKW